MSPLETHQRTVAAWSDCAAAAARRFAERVEEGHALLAHIDAVLERSGRRATRSPDRTHRRRNARGPGRG